MEGYFSVEEAASRLGISSATVRRRIRKGELKAVKEQGHYGEQYYIPIEEVNTAQTTPDIVPLVKPPLDPIELDEKISAAVRRESEELRQEIRGLRQELADLEKQQEERAQEQGGWIIAQIRTVLEEKKRPWWSRLKGKNINNNSVHER